MQKGGLAARVVLDTNIVVSGLLWGGPPQHVIGAALIGNITLFTSQLLLNELELVLRRPKLAPRFIRLGYTPDELLDEYTRLVSIVIPSPLPQPVADDPDDDAVLACAVAAQAALIVSGDDDLLRLGAYQQISILTATAFLAQFTPSASDSV